MKFQTIHSKHHHFKWDNSRQPVLTIAPGDTVDFEILEASGGRIRPDSTAADILNLDSDVANPVTGPVFIDSAEPGDTLVVDVLDCQISQWGWTGIIPGFGLLANDFSEPYLHHSRYSSDFIEFTPDIKIPTRPFPGTIGIAPAAAGEFSTIPPLPIGGNIDCRDLTIGARLFLPVQVSGALFSVGDTHAAQGDGEVCGTAIESPMTIRLRFSLIKQQQSRFPRLLVNKEPAHASQKYVVTLGIADSLMNAATEAIREMIDHLMKTYGLSAELAYCLCSVAVHLKITEVVNAPNWVVGAYLPTDIFK